MGTFTKAERESAEWAEFVEGALCDMSINFETMLEAAVRELAERQEKPGGEG